MKRYIILRPCVAAPILAFFACGCGEGVEPTSPEVDAKLAPDIGLAPIALPQLPTGPLPPIGAHGAPIEPLRIFTSTKPKPDRDICIRHPWKCTDAGTPPATDAGDAAPEPDSGTVDPPDSGIVEPPDAGVVEPDSGIVEPPDAGVVEPDSGVVEPPDAGVGEPDSGVVEPPDAGVEPDSGVVEPPDAGSITRTIDMRALVLTAQGFEPSFDALTRFLDRLGTPYDAIVASMEPFDASTLSDGVSHGRYTAVFLATAGLGFEDSAGQWRSALTPEQWATLEAYERDFGVREVQYYAYPNSTIGLAPSGDGYDTTGSPVMATLSPAGAHTFFYVNGREPIPVTGAWVYPAQVIDPMSTTVLVGGANGEALTVLHQFPDGREAIINTMDNNFFLVHSLAYHYGLVNWAFRGVFPGERHVYLAEQVDDLFIDNDLWQPSGESNETVRITGAELNNIAVWQSAVQQSLPSGSQFQLAMAFNAIGTMDGEYPGDTLTSESVALSNQFHWINHTWDHENLDALDYNACHAESMTNIKRAEELGLYDFYRDNMVTPDISGLQNAPCLEGLHDSGVRYVVGNTSIPWMTPAQANLGMPVPSFPEILIVPRHPTNLFYNVMSPEQWVGEYNDLYRTYFGHDLTYAELLDVESSIALQYLLAYDNNPLMFHQANLALYDSPVYGVSTTIGDWTQALLDKYARILTLPIVSEDLRTIAERMLDKMEYEACDARATLTMGAEGRMITVSAPNGCTVPLTGVARPEVGAVEEYGGQFITWITLAPGQAVSFPL